MTWTAEKRVELHKLFGPYLMTPERDGSETAYLVTFPDDRAVRVLPGAASAQKRARVTTTALASIVEQVGGRDQAAELAADGIPPIMDPVTYLIGALTLHHMTWELVSSDDPLQEWLAKWFVDVDLSNPELPKYLVDDLDHAGWVVVAKEAS
jgi:hypothetical protein